MADETLAQALAQNLGDEVASNPKLLQECISICKIYDITAETLKYKWEAATFKSSGVRAHEPEARFTMDSLAGVKAQIKREMNKTNVAKVQPRTFTGTAAVNIARLPQFMNRNTAGGVGRVAAGGDRDIELKTEPGLDTSYLAGPSRSSSSSTVVLSGPKLDASSRKKRGYRYMYEKLSERGEVLDDRIEEMGDRIKKHYGLEDLGDPSLTTDEEIYVVGRITHDSETLSSTSRLTEANLTIDSSRASSAGARVSLRFEADLKIRGGPQGAGAAALFPGAIVALKGKNGSGSWFAASELLLLPPPKPLTTTTKRDYPADTPFSMAIGCGPYTSDSDLEYAPWRSFLSTLKASRPDVIFLNGPFIDYTHPSIASGQIDETPLALFHRVILEPLSKLLDSCPGSIAVLTPSVKDIINSHAVYPQREFGTDVTRNDPRIHLLPNPGRFSINGVSFITTSVDVLFHLRKEEVTIRGEEVDSISPQFPEDTGTDSMGNLCRHILQQRSVYPIFPVHTDLSVEVNLDITHSKGLDLDPEASEDSEHAPDVFISPSKLKQFSKRVNSTLFINPGSVSRTVYGTLKLSAQDMGISFGERLKGDVWKLGTGESR